MAKCVNFDTEIDPLAAVTAGDLHRSRPCGRRPTSIVIGPMDFARSTRLAQGLTPDVVAAFARDGACVVRGLFDPADLALLRQGVEENLHSPSPRAKIASGPDDPGLFFEDFCNWQGIDAFRRFVTSSPAAAAAGALMGAQAVRFYHDHVLVKTPGTRQRTPWHQDQPYYNIEGHQNVSFWIPIDPVARASSLEFVAGSHLGPWLMPRTFRDNEARWFPDGALADLPDIEADRAAHPILGWALEPGDAVCFHMLTLHAAAGVAPGQTRRVFSARFLGDDIRHAPRPWPTSPEFPGLIDQLPAGAPMDHPLFPVLWRRDVDAQPADAHISPVLRRAGARRGVSRRGDQANHPRRP